MIPRNHLAVAAYLGAVALAVVLLFATGEIFLGALVPFVSGVILAIYLAIHVAVTDTTRRDVTDLLLICAVLVLGPTVWYLLYGCVFGCLGT